QEEYRFAVPAPATQLPSLNGDDPFAPLRLLEYRRQFGKGAEWMRNYPVVDPASPLLFAGNVGFLMYVEKMPGDKPLSAPGWDELKWDPGMPLHIYHNARVMARYYLVPEVRTAASPQSARDALKGIDPHRTAVVEGNVDCHQPA